MKLQQNIIFLLVLFLAIILVGNVEGDDENISISALKYTNDLETGNEKIIHLKNQLGKMRKRAQPIVIRYHKVSLLKNVEIRKFQCILTWRVFLEY